MPRQIEAGLQEAVVRYLRLTLRDCVVFSIPNGGLRSFKTAKLMKRTGALAGVFDLEILAPGGRCFFMEIKADKGALSPAQQVFKLALIRMGHPYAVIRSLDDVEAALIQWGLKQQRSSYVRVKATEDAAKSITLWDMGITSGQDGAAPVHRIEERAGLVLAEENPPAATGKPPTKNKKPTRPRRAIW
jgi:hypothetical protein